ncbi:MAG: rod shape-determining protein RodA [Porticoccaceae bacterium]|jgi:rod shape determining protein RodA|nr:MAG: rod shape-determining protein RodA [Porticoccaceae bacterium]
MAQALSKPDFDRHLREPGAVVYGRRSHWLIPHVDPVLTLLLLILMAAGLLVLYSASGRDMDQVQRQMLFMGAGLAAMSFAAQIPPRMLLRWSWLPYVLGTLLLVGVDLFGSGAKGAQRWLAIGPARFQPSELLKIAVPLVLSAYFGSRLLPPRFKEVCLAVALLLVPLLLVAIQPDLGTAILIGSGGAFVLFLAGIGMRYLAVALIGALTGAPALWFFALHDYQKNRILTLLDPQQDKLGAGWNIIQSTTAIGSGGLTGKGWFQGTQSQLDFLPESHTDFIIAVLSEEFGFIAVLALLALYMLIVVRGLIISLAAPSMFGRLLAGSISLTFFLYVFVNMGMVAGLLPIVGVPLPMVSYGGTSVVTLCIGFGILMAVRSETDTRG